MSACLLGAAGHFRKESHCKDSSTRRSPERNQTTASPETGTGEYGLSVSDKKSSFFHIPYLTGGMY